METEGEGREICRTDSQAEDIAALASATVDMFWHGEFESVSALPNEPGVVAVKRGAEFFIEIKPA